MKNAFIAGNISVNGYSVPLVMTKLIMGDYPGTVMVRWGIGRDNYRINPGLYAVGNPDSGSDVFVTANYKLSFDTLRKNLSGQNGFILVLDTKGVNVWCAAGKGTFSTKELVNRINLVSLNKIVNHRRLILPQLSATGVAAHKVKEETGFNVHYGPIRAEDIKLFLSAGYKATREMRKVRFGLWDRIKLIPVEITYGKYYLLGGLLLIVILSCIGLKDISLHGVLESSRIGIISLLMAYVSGIIIAPVFLPYLPGRSFSLKGFTSGVIVSIILILLKISGSSILEMISWILIISSASSFLTMNFTGSSTFTSLSGVKKEMKVAVPLQIGLSGAGIVLLIIAKLLY